MEGSKQDVWLVDHPVVDIFVMGEEPFLRIVGIWFETRSLEAVKQAGINGVYALIDDKLFKDMANQNQDLLLNRS